MKVKLAFSERLDDLMKDRKINAIQLHEKTGISTTTISDMLNGKRDNPTANAIIKLSQALNVSSDYLLGLSDVQSTDLDIKDICKKTKLSQRAVESLMIYANDFPHSIQEYFCMMLEDDDFTYLLESIDNYVNSRLSNDGLLPNTTSNYSISGIQKIEKIEETIKKEKLRVVLLRDYEAITHYEKEVENYISYILKNMYSRIEKNKRGETNGNNATV